MALLALAVLAFASFGQFFEISNETGYDISFIYISYTASDDWGGDWLGEDILADGETVVFDMSDYNWDTELFDIQLEDVDGDTYTFIGMDAEDYSDPSLNENVFTVTLSDLD
jgi:hypothetical protein